jgi:glutamate synthase domain-containing protein 3
MVKVENLIIKEKNIKKSDYESEFKVYDDILVDDDLRIKYLLDLHIKHTNSNLAKNIIENWNHSSKSFKKIMPVDYKKVLLENKNNNIQSKIVA